MSEQTETMLKNIREGMAMDGQAPHALTREQMFLDTIKALQCLYITVDEPIAKDVNEKVMSLIESYRNDLAQQAQEIEAIRNTLRCHRAYIIESINDLKAKTDDIPNIDRMRQAEQEVERLKKGCESAYALHVDDDNRLFALEQQLAASQQRVGELELRWKPVEESARKTFEIESLPILLNGGTRGQERLAQIIASWHEAEKKCATLQATLAAREAEFQEAMQQAHRALKGGQ